MFISGYASTVNVFYCLNILNWFRFLMLHCNFTLDYCGWKPCKGSFDNVYVCRSVSVCLFIYLFICLFICLPACLSVYLVVSWLLVTSPLIVCELRKAKDKTNCSWEIVSSTNQPYDILFHVSTLSKAPTSLCTLDHFGIPWCSTVEDYSDRRRA